MFELVDEDSQCVELEIDTKNVDDDPRMEGKWMTRLQAVKQLFHSFINRSEA